MTKAPYEVRLSQLDDGSVLVHVGCKVLSYRHDDPQLAADVVEYFQDPGGMVRRFSAAFGWLASYASGRDGLIGPGANVKVKYDIEKKLVE